MKNCFCHLQELLIYKWEAVDNGLSSSIRFDKIWSRSFSKPLLSINDLDIMNDGMKELIVISLTGVHILQVGFLHLGSDTEVG